MKFAISHRISVRNDMSQTPSAGTLSNGEVLILFANLVDVMPDCRLFLTRSSDDGLTWSAPQDVARSELPRGGVEGTLTCIDDVVFVAYIDGCDLKRNPSNPVVLNVIRSTDGGRTFPTKARFDGDGLRRHGGFCKIIRLRETGELLLPLYTARLIRILGSSDNGETWSQVGCIDQGDSVRAVDCCEAALLELPSGRLLSIMRGDSMDSEAFPYGFRSISDDAGRTWSTPEQLNINLCEPRLMMMPTGEILLTARSCPGNMYHYYRPITDEERPPGSKQKLTTSICVVDEFLSPIRQYGVMMFTSVDEGKTFEPQITMEDPRGLNITDDDEPLWAFRHQAGSPDITVLDDGRYLVVFRQPDPKMPQLEQRRTYSHVFQRYVAANIVECLP